MRALIVDDDAVNTRLLQEILSPYADCLTAGDGRAGVRAFCAALDAGKPVDLVFMDIMMPGMDGHQALEQIRDIEARRGLAKDRAVKAIMVSSLDDHKHKARAFFHGQAMSFLRKPFSVEDVLVELRKFDLIE